MAACINLKSLMLAGVASRPAPARLHSLIQVDESSDLLQTVNKSRLQTARQVISMQALLLRVPSLAEAATKLDSVNRISVSPSLA